MARVSGPLLSQDAAGSVGGALRFRHDGGGVHVYRGGEPGSRKGAVAATEAQAAVRERYRAANRDWRGLRTVDRAEWVRRARATGRDVSGWNLFLAAWMADPALILTGVLMIDGQTRFGLEGGAGVLLLEDGT